MSGSEMSCPKSRGAKCSGPKCQRAKRPGPKCRIEKSWSKKVRGARWLSGRMSDSGARGPGFETYRRRVVSLSKTLYSPKVLGNYPGSDGSVPT